MSDYNAAKPLSTSRRRLAFFFALLLFVPEVTSTPLGLPQRLRNPLEKRSVSKRAEPTTHIVHHVIVTPHGGGPSDHDAILHHIPKHVLGLKSNEKSVIVQSTYVNTGSHAGAHPGLQAPGQHHPGHAPSQGYHQKQLEYPEEHQRVQEEVDTESREHQHSKPEGPGHGTETNTVEEMEHDGRENKGRDHEGRDHEAKATAHENQPSKEPDNEPSSKSHTPGDKHHNSEANHDAHHDANHDALHDAHHDVQHGTGAIHRRDSEGRGESILAE